MNITLQQSAMMNALKIINEKWSMAVIHQIRLGKECFNQIADGLPHLSPTLISNRLKSLLRQQVIAKAKKSSGTGYYYQLTSLGQQFAPVLDLLCEWGISAKQEVMTDEEKEMNALLVQTVKKLNFNSHHQQSLVMKIDVINLPRFREWWLVVDQGEAVLVMDEPQKFVNGHLKTDSETFRLIAESKLNTREALLSQRLSLSGDKHICNEFHQWFTKNNNHKIKRIPKTKNNLFNSHDQKALAL